VSLGADLLSIYDDARRNLDDVATYNADGDYVEMLASTRRYGSVTHC